MKKSFACSLLCQNGIIGGTISIEERAITYQTNKLTVDKRYRPLILPTGEIGELSWKRVLFPIAVFTMKNGAKYQFLLFGKKRFEEYYAKITNTNNKKD